MITAQISELNKKYNSYTLGVDDISFIVHEGEVFGIIGANGAGKSTIMRTLTGLLKPTSGGAAIFQQDTFCLGHIARNDVGYLGGEVSYFGNKTVLENLRFVADMHSVNMDRVDDLATKLELNLTRKAKDLSLGNLKKMGIVMALLASPKLIILDEPTNGLDVIIKQKFYSIIDQEKKRGASIIISSHNLQDIQRLCDRVAILKDGKIVAIEDMKSLKDKVLKKVTIHSSLDNIDLKLTGVSDVVHDGCMMSFTYTGEIKKLIKALNSLDIQDFTVADADIESVFMHFYAQGE